MSIISTIKGWFKMIFGEKARQEFDIESIISPEMVSLITKCENIYAGKPFWLDDEDNIKTVNFAKAICSETARLATLAIGIKVDGSGRAKWLQEQIDNVYGNLRTWTEYGCAYGTIILKPSGKGVDFVKPNDFIITDQEGDKIMGAAFITREVDGTGKKFYTRIEYHRFDEDNIYCISNRCYVGKKADDLEKRVDIEATPWAGLQDDVQIDDLDSPLFAVFKTPHANNIDTDSPMGLPVFSDAIEELKDLDIAYSRNAKEVKDSKRTVLLDSDRMVPVGTPLQNQGAYFDKQRKEMGLPDIIKNVYGDGQQSFYQEINPVLNTETRLVQINALLNQIGYKCGFSNGYFVFNEKNGIQTATQVESEDQRTIQFIKDVRDKLEQCLEDLIQALDAFSDLYDLSPTGSYKVSYDFGDITYNYEEDKARWYAYVTAGKVPFWYYLVKFEGFSEEDAKELEQSAQRQEPEGYEEE